MDMDMEERGRGFASDREAWAELKECIERTKPVSYTHLDVYKRQVLGTLAVGLGCYPFDHGFYYSQSDCWKAFMRHS